MIVDIDGCFQRLLDCREDPEIARVLKRHRFVFAGRTTVERRLVEAGRLSTRGAGIALVNGGEVPRAAAAIARGGDPSQRGLVVLAIDDPESQPAVAPRRHFADLGMPVVEPGDLDGLRLAIEQAAALSDAVDGPAAIVVDEKILRSAATLNLRPDRVVATRDTAAALHRTRCPRSGKDEDLARFARRLELDATLAMPSPGEQEEIGIISTGVAATSVRHILEEFRLTGRVPAVLLRLVEPVDPAPIERLLTRCRTVVVIETRPGLLAPAVIEIGERLRASGRSVASVGWRSVPGVDSDPIEVADASRPSVLIRRILPGLRRIRSGPMMEDRLASPVSEVASNAPGRPAGMSRGLLQTVRRATVAADRILRREDVEDAEPIALAINGRSPTSFNGRVVATEIVERRRLLEEAVPLVASKDPRSARIILVADEGWSDGLDAVRILEGAVPVVGERVAKVRRIEARTDSDVRDAIVLAARAASPEVLVIHRRDPRGMVDTEELDRLGYAPIIRVRSRLDDACGVRARDDFKVDATLPRPDDIRSEFSVDPVQDRLRGRWYARVARLIEISEIVRQREPLPATPLYVDPLPPPPVPRHRKSGRWRAHVAGMRGTAPGAAATLLARAGLAMGFDSRLVHQPDRLATGLGAWAQILFTRPARAGVADTLVPEIPYGEADLIVGVDPMETMRALGPDERLRIATQGRTAIIAEEQGLVEDVDSSMTSSLERLPLLAAEACGTADDRVERFADRVRQQFGNPRLLDVVLLGVAFQLGLVPVTIEAMESAIEETDHSGFGRTGDAFRFGRLLAIRSPIQRSMTDGLDAIERRRRELVLAGRLRRGRASARSLDERIRTALDRLPGLAETSAGREALDDLLMAIGRLHRRGGLPLVDEYLDRLARIHAADRGDTGRELTRKSVLVLGEAMLPRDLVAYAIAATSLDHRRRKHRRFGIRRARGDRVERALMARLDLIGFERHVKMEIPVPVWGLGLVARMGRLVPFLRAGDSGSRRRRAAVEKAIDLAISSADDSALYRIWAARLGEWEALAIDGRLHNAPLSQFE